MTTPTPTPTPAAAQEKSDDTKAASKKTGTSIVVAVNRILRGDGKDDNDIKAGTIFEIEKGSDELKEYIDLGAVREPTETELAVYAQRRKGKGATAQDELLG